jgi:hypothetical protein
VDLVGWCFFISLYFFFTVEFLSWRFEPTFHFKIATTIPLNMFFFFTTGALWREKTFTPGFFFFSSDGVGGVFDFLFLILGLGKVW